MGTVRTEPLKAGEVRTFPHSAERVSAAALIALDAARYDVAERDRFRRRLMYVGQRSDTTGAPFGSVARMVVEPVAAESALTAVRIIVRSRSPLSPGAKDDEDALYEKLALALALPAGAAPLVAGSRIRATTRDQTLTGRLVNTDADSVRIHIIGDLNASLAHRDVITLERKEHEFQTRARARRYRTYGALFGVGAASLVALTLRRPDNAGASELGWGGAYLDYLMAQTEAELVALGILVAAGYGGAAGYAVGYVSAPRWRPIVRPARGSSSTGATTLQLGAGARF